MANLYLVGGAPRVGKGKILQAFVKKRPVQAFSTDAIRTILRSAKINPTIKSIPDFPGKNLQEVLDNEINESKAIWKYLLPLCDEILSKPDETDTFIEGIAILPELVKKLPSSAKIIFVGNTTNNEIAVKLAEQDPTDWLHKHPIHKTDFYKEYFVFASQYYKSEAAKYGFEYIEMQNGKFEDNVQKVVNNLLR